jgi:acyl dehydratase
MGRWFEDLEPGWTYEHRPGRTISEADNILFCTLTMNTQSLHLDSEFAARTEFGSRLVNSLLTLATIVGLSVADLTEGTTIANLGFESTMFPAPVFIGDTLFSETEIVSKRLSNSRPDCGIVVFEHRGLNQHKALVCVARRLGMIRRVPNEQQVVFDPD